MGTQKYAKKATTRLMKEKAERKLDAFRLRMIFGEWFIYQYCEGKELERLGPLDWRTASSKCEAMRSANIQDLDRCGNG